MDNSAHRFGEDRQKSRVLAAIPAYNEAATIEQVIRRVRESLPDFDLLVVNDGSTDATGELLDRLNVTVARHLSNLGYGRAIQTAIKFAEQCEYDFLITLDADGQHYPEQVLGLYEASRAEGWDLLIGSRYVKSHDYSDSPLGRRTGMRLFSMLVRAIAGRRIYDTTSGLKVIRRPVFKVLSRWHFIDFHAEAIVYLLRLGYSIGEYNVTVAARTHGQSMYSMLSHIAYPLKTALILLLGVLEAELTRRKQSV